MKSVVVVAVLLLAAVPAGGQSEAHLRIGISARALEAPGLLSEPGGREQPASLACDPSRIHDAEAASRRGNLFLTVGAILAIGGGFIDATSMTPRLIGGGLAIYGGYLKVNKADKSAAWDQSIQELKVGTSTAADIRACLGNPTTTNTSGGDETWFYAGMSPGFLSSGSYRSLRLTIRSGVLANIDRSTTTF